MADESVVKIENLTKRYGHLTALEDLSISLNRGQILGFIGPNGAGKTTTIKVLVGLIRPTSGSAFVAGCDCTRDIKKLKQVIGYMPDTFGSYDNMRVREYLDFFGAAFKIPPRERSKRVDEVMELTGATYMKDRFVESLSHGMKQRVSLARTMLHDPEVLILDEPANGLDPQARIEMRQIIVRLSELGKTLIVTSHILPELSRICNVVAIITQGKLRAFGSLGDIMKRVGQQRRYACQLLSNSDISTAVKIIRMHIEKDAWLETIENESRIMFSTGNDDQAMARLLSELAQADLGVAEFAELQVDLEDAFMSVAGIDPVMGKTAESKSAGRGTAH